MLWHLLTSPAEASTGPGLDGGRVLGYTSRVSEPAAKEGPTEEAVQTVDGQLPNFSGGLEAQGWRRGVVAKPRLLSTTHTFDLFACLTWSQVIRMLLVQAQHGTENHLPASPRSLVCSKPLEDPAAQALGVCH